MTTERSSYGAGESHKGDACAQVQDHLAQLLESRAAPNVEPAPGLLGELEEHIRACDSCRDLLFDAGEAVQLAKQAAADYRVSEDLVARVLARADAAPRVGEAPTLDRVQRAEPRVEVVGHFGRAPRSPRARWYQFLGAVAAPLRYSPWSCGVIRTVHCRGPQMI